MLLIESDDIPHSLRVPTSTEGEVPIHLHLCLWLWSLFVPARVTIHSYRAIQGIPFPYSDHPESGLIMGLDPSGQYGWS